MSKPQKGTIMPHTLLKTLALCLALTVPVNSPAFAAIPAFASSPHHFAPASLPGFGSISDQFSEYADRFRDIFSGMDDGTILNVFDFLQDKAQDGSLDTEEGIADAIEEGQEKFGFELSDEHMESMIELIVILEDMGFDSEKIIGSAKSLYEEHGPDFLEHGDELLRQGVGSGIVNVILTAIGDFFSMLGDALKGFFTSTISRIKSPGTFLQNVT